MRIGIDIDDTTVVTVVSMLKYADIYDRDVLGKRGRNNKFGLVTNNNYLQQLYDWTDLEKRNFFTRYYGDVLKECVPMMNASEVITKLKDEGCKIYFITARISSIENCDTLKVTKETLNHYNIPYDKLIIDASDKLKYSLENEIDIFIEDSFETCKLLEANGIKTYLMTTEMNKDVDSSEIERVSTWDELYEKLLLSKEV